MSQLGEPAVRVQLSNYKMKDPSDASTVLALQDRAHTIEKEIASIQQASQRARCYRHRCLNHLCTQTLNEMPGKPGLTGKLVDAEVFHPQDTIFSYI